jgi:hypothetical protein
MLLLLSQHLQLTRFSAFPATAAALLGAPTPQTYCDVDMLVYASVWLPWPFAERDVLISAVADDQLREKGVVAISFASPRDAPVSGQQGRINSWEKWGGAGERTTCWHSLRAC